MSAKGKKYYRTGEFAQKAGVTKRTLRYYDRIGLLKPCYRTDHDHRLYSEDDFVRLQQIVTLKFIGFTLSQIKKIMESHDIDLKALLRMQREWMEGKLQDLQIAVQAMKDAELAIQKGDEAFFDKIQRVIGVIEMQTSRNWLNEFLQASVSGREEKAKAILAAYPEISNLSIYSAAVLGEVETVGKMLESDPSLAIQQGGPEHWEPHLYLSFSCFLKDTEKSDRFAQTAQILLDHGANPNAFCLQKDDPYERRLSALYGVVGLANNPVVAKVFLEAGANPNDGESLYHAAEFSQHECLDLLYDYGVELNTDPAFFRKLDFDDEEGVRWFLEHGVDPNRVFGHEHNTPLHWAVYRGRSVETLNLLLKHGAHVNSRRADYMTPYTLAVRFGHSEAAEFLLQYGASEELDRIDQFFGACATLDESKVREILAQEPSMLSRLSHSDQEMLIEFVELNKPDTVKLLLDFGFDHNVKKYGGTALHHAAWFGYIDIVQLLIKYGFSLKEKNEYGGTPLGSALHGSLHCKNNGSHAAVVEALIQAGSVIPEKADGNKEVMDVLRRYGVTD